MSTQTRIQKVIQKRIQNRIQKVVQKKIQKAIDNRIMSRLEIPSKSFLLFSGVLLAFSLSGVGCAHSVHQYSVNDYDSLSGDTKPGRTIEADAEQFVILAFAFNTDYADEAYRKLLINCPQGEVVGVNARYSTSMSFLSYTNKMHLQAICLE